MARPDTNVTSLGFRLRTTGIVGLQQTVKFNAQKADELISAIDARVTVVEGYINGLVAGLDNSNSQFIDNQDSNSQFINTP